MLVVKQKQYPRHHHRRGWASTSLDPLALSRDELTCRLHGNRHPHPGGSIHRRDDPRTLLPHRRPQVCLDFELKLRNIKKVSINNLTLHNNLIIIRVSDFIIIF